MGDNYNTNPIIHSKEYTKSNEEFNSQNQPDGHDPEGFISLKGLLLNEDMDKEINIMRNKEDEELINSHDEPIIDEQEQEELENIRLHQEIMQQKNSKLGKTTPELYPNQNNEDEEDDGEGDDEKPNNKNNKKVEKSDNEIMEYEEYNFRKSNSLQEEYDNEGEEYDEFI